MLVRCFSRDLIQLIIKSRFNLRESQLVLYEDSPLLSRQLLQTLKDDPRTESAWIYNGSVWSKMASNGKIVKFNLLDDIDTKINEESAKKLGRPTQKKPQYTRKPRSAWQKNKRQSLLNMTMNAMNNHLPHVNSSIPGDLTDAHPQPLPATDAQPQPTNLRPVPELQHIDINAHLQPLPATDAHPHPTNTRNVPELQHIVTSPPGSRNHTDVNGSIHHV
jgi:hypothetical protein